VLGGMVRGDWAWKSFGKENGEPDVGCGMEGQG
jgi:hypothetical protein